jgi:uracil-DNA glycosylase family 4
MVRHVRRSRPSSYPVAGIAVPGIPAHSVAGVADPGIPASASATPATKRHAASVFTSRSLSAMPSAANVAMNAPAPQSSMAKPLPQPDAIATPASPDASFAARMDQPELSADEKRKQLAVMDETEVRGCTKCVLCKTRTQTVFGEGDPNAKIFFIGEGPGENEDLTGRPFVGKAGQLLDKMIVAMGLRREQVFIANIVKCRPPGNRVPAPEEVTSCTAYLERQLEIVRPKAIVTLGLPATRYMLQSNASMGSMRGKFHSWRGISLMPTYHPSYVLRVYTEQTRAAVWSDLQQVMTLLSLHGPARKRTESES